MQINNGTPLGASISQCGSSGIPVYLWLQWSSSVFQLCKLTLEHHWVLASASVVPVASQCTCGSSGLPVRSVQWYPSVLTIWFWGHWVRSLPSMRPLMYTTAMVRVVWTKLISFDLQPQIHKNYNGAHIKGMHRVMLKYSHMLRAELASIAEQSTPSKGWIYRDLSTCLLVSRHLVISNWRGCYSAYLTICVGACVGCHRPSSGVPV